ncbi:MAG: anthranilate phosphoribosyltransferase [Proteobacteria bacterium]|nr:anthranilate phosphoribosyltransferase [Pseudomonadota bacterium]
MLTETDRKLGNLINRLIRKENLTRKDTKDAFITIIDQKTTDMQQGAFLSALTAKGESSDEIAGCFEAIYERDTTHVTVGDHFPVVENCGTGMDTQKTYNISTAASILGAAGGIKMARHGARAITSVCGTVDIAEALGVDVECGVSIVSESIEKANIGLFNGMSPEVHPQALGRILSQISFGSTLNIAASLANPALPKLAVRGVYKKEMMLPALTVMKAIGYRRALIVFGTVDHSEKGMDEASVCGTTYLSELKENGDMDEFSFRPHDMGLGTHAADELRPAETIEQEARQFVALIRGNKNGARKDAAVLNAGLIYYISGHAADIPSGVKQASRMIEDGAAFKTLENWVTTQNRTPDKGFETLQGWLS